MRFVERFFIAVFVCLVMHLASLGSASAAVDRTDCGVAAVSVAIAGDSQILARDVHATTGDECGDGQCNSLTCHCFCHGGVAAALAVATPVLANNGRVAIQPLGMLPSVPVHILPPIRPPQA